MRKKILLITPLIFAGCEAPLVLDGLAKTADQSIRRTDIFMSATASSDKLVVVGSEGVILEKDKGADQWRRHQIEAKPSLVQVTLCPNGTFASLSMEGDVWTAKDDLAKWTAHSLGTPEVPQAITCDERNVLWVVGSFSTILSSQDFGESWNDASLGEDTILSTVQYVDKENGYITGEFGYILTTNNGGQSWNFADPVPNEFSPLSSYFESQTHGWIGGLNGTIYETTDGGQSWEREETNVSAPIFGITKAGNRVIAVGDYGTVISKNPNKNEAWEKVPMPIESRFFYRLNEAVSDSQVLIGGAGMLSLVDLNEIK